MIDEILGSAEAVEIDFELKLIICENDKPKPIAKGKIKSVFEIDEDDIEDIMIAAEEIAAEAATALGFDIDVPEFDLNDLIPGGAESDVQYPAGYDEGYGW